MAAAAHSDRRRGRGATVRVRSVRTGCGDGLRGSGPFTVFIPTDDAFDAYLTEAGMTQAEVFADRAALRRSCNITSST